MFMRSVGWLKWFSKDQWCANDVYESYSQKARSHSGRLSHDWRFFIAQKWLSHNGRCFDKNNLGLTDSTWNGYGDHVPVKVDQVTFGQIFLINPKITLFRNMTKWVSKKLQFGHPNDLRPGEDPFIKKLTSFIMRKLLLVTTFVPTILCIICW